MSNKPASGPDHAEADGQAKTNNPDPTITGGTGRSPTGENMPPRGGEDIGPADGARSPAATQEQSKT